MRQRRKLLGGATDQVEDIEIIAEALRLIKNNGVDLNTVNTNNILQNLQNIPDPDNELLQTLTTIMDQRPPDEITYMFNTAKQQVLLVGGRRKARTQKRMRTKRHRRRSRRRSRRR